MPAGIAIETFQGVSAQTTPSGARTAWINVSEARPGYSSPSRWYASVP